MTMIKECRKKLNSNTGASLMVALLFFVVMAVIGSVILAAATSSADRTKKENLGNQERYALYSAANLVVNAFAGKDITGNINPNAQKYQTPDVVTYYINNDTGERYKDSSLSTEFTTNDEKTAWENVKYTQNTTGIVDSEAKDLKGIVAQVFSPCWEGITENWNEDEDVYLSSFTYPSDTSTDNTDFHTYKFTLTGKDDWSENADAFKAVDVTLTVQNDMDITGVFSIHKQSDEKLKKEVSGMKYYIRIPFSSDARIKYTSENKTENSDGEKITVTETQKIELDNFHWADRDQTTISTNPISEDSDDSTDSTIGN